MTLCRVCRKRKPIDQFYPRQVRANKKVGECKVCTRRRVAENRRRNADYYREYDAKRFQEDPRVRERHERYRKTQAGKYSLQRSRDKWMRENPEKDRHITLSKMHCEMGASINRSGARIAGKNRLALKATTTTIQSRWM